MQEKRQALLIIACAVLTLFSCTACDLFGEVKTNVPSQGDFKPFMLRDLNSHFSSTMSKHVDVEFELLRKSPTSVGRALPKYYLWVKILEGKTLVDEGAVRVAAIEKTHFEVTDFLSAEQIRKKPGLVLQTFPKVLCADLVARATSAD